MTFFAFQKSFTWVRPQYDRWPKPGQAEIQRAIPCTTRGITGGYKKSFGFRLAETLARRIPIYCKGGPPLNPEGIPASSPRLRRRSYLGKWFHNNPQPRWGCGLNDMVSQGSSFLATLSFETGATGTEGQLARRASSSPSPPRSGGEGRGEVVLRVQGDMPPSKSWLIESTSNGCPSLFVTPL